MIYLIRHAQSLANKQGVFGLNLPLSLEGINQAKDSIDEYSFIDIFYSSELIRAKQTAEILSSKKVEPLKEFNELYVGSIEGKLVKDYDDEYNKGNFKKFIVKYGGDNLSERLSSTTEKLYQLNELNKTIGIVTSDTLMRCLYLQLTKWENWTSLSEAPLINNLDSLKITFENGIKIEKYDK